jgi:large subunit ribosomal protein L15
MKLHSLESIKKRTQRIGRSGKRGSYSGRGVKGQRSRSGHRIRPALRDLIIRLPKLRGFRNKPKDDAAEIFNLCTISSKLKSHVEGKTPLLINRELLKSVHLLKKDFRGGIKILGTGEIAFPITTAKGVEVSKSAKMKIEKAGGSIA